MKIRIISGGTSDHTEIWDMENKKPITNARAVKLECDAGGLWKATLEFVDVEVRMVAEKDEKSAD